MTFTKEQLIARLERHKETAASIAPTVRHLPIAHEMALMDIHLAELALAGLESEPVAWLWSNRKHPSEVTLVRPEDDDRAEAAQWSGWSCQALYSAPQPATAVPGELDYQGAKELFNYLMTEEETNATVNGWNACRAAMLSGDKS